MELFLPPAQGYASRSQQIRVTSEPWVRENVFCPNCGRESLTEFENNRKVADFYCETCRYEYELKSKRGGLGRKIVDGAYSSMMERVASANNPSFFFLTYERETRAVRDFLVIPQFFFTPRIIERRKPLSPTAKRAGWVGCNILMDRLPLSGRIHYVRGGVEVSKQEVRDTWERTKPLLADTTQHTRGWLLDVLGCVEKLGQKEFTLADMYGYEHHLRARHPDNEHIRPKIRQQLQLLRDRGYLRFVARGVYRLT